MIKLDLGNEIDDWIIDPIDLLDSKIGYNSATMDMETILVNLNRGDFVLPKFQRKYTWSKDDLTKLIISLIRNIPIPPVYLYFEKNTHRYVILDGQQRITSLFLYFNDLFYKTETNRKRINFKEVYEILKTLERNNDEEILETENNLNIFKKLYLDYDIEKMNVSIKDGLDLTFTSLDDVTKRIIRRKSIEVIFVKCEKEDATRIYSDIFKLLNSAGKALHPQEIRNGVHIDNPLYEKLNELNESNKVWRSLYGKESSNYRDLEYLLRFLALDEYLELLENNRIDLSERHAFNLASFINLLSEKYDRKLLTAEDEKILDLLKEKVKSNIELTSDEKEKNKDIEDKIQKIQEQEEESTKLVEKLKKFFDMIKGVENITSSQSILILEAFFIAFSKLDLLGKVTIDYNEFFTSLDKKDYVLNASTGTKTSVFRRINRAIETIKKEYRYEIGR